jgi:hypothetical protein
MRGAVSGNKRTTRTLPSLPADTCSLGPPGSCFRRLATDEAIHFLLDGEVQMIGLALPEIEFAFKSLLAEELRAGRMFAEVDQDGRFRVTGTPAHTH